MRLKVIPTKTDKKLYLVKTIKKPGAKYTTTKAIECFGSLSELEKIYDDPIAHFKEVARRRTEEEKARKDEQKLVDPIKVDLNAHVDFNEEGLEDGKYDNYLHLGQMPLLRLYHMLELDDFLARKRKSWGIRSGMEVIYKLLVIGRIICPGSKLATWQQLRHFKLGNSKPTDDDVYNALEFIGSSSEEVLLHLNEVIKRKTGRNTSLMYYDVTNYYCEIDDPDNAVDGGLRRRGVCKEHRPEPIIQMGLFMDGDGLPVTYGIFPGNNNDVTTFIPMMNKTTDDYGMKKIIYVADKGMMSHDNIVHILSHGCGYVISDSPRKKQEKDIMDFLHDPCGYKVKMGGDGNSEVVFKYKERTVPMKRSGVTYRGEGEKKTCTVEYNEVQIVFWSKKYAERARKQRYEALEKVMRNPKVFDDYNVKGLLKKIPVDPRDGAVRDDMEYIVELDREKLQEAEALDGYYIIRSNVIGRNDEEKPWEGEYRFRRDNLFQLNKDVDAMSIIDMYRGLWEIEETFKITKSFLSTRPIYVRKESSIRAHFTTCFIALLMVRLLERQTGNKLNHSEVLDAVRQSIVAEISPGVYRNIATSRNMEIIGNSMGMDLTKLWYTANEIRTLNAKPKN